MKITKQHIRLDLIENNQTKTLIDSDLPWPVRAEESTWSLVPGEFVHVDRRRNDFVLKRKEKEVFRCF